MRTRSYEMQKKLNHLLPRIMISFSLNSFRRRKRGNRDEQFKFPMKKTPNNMAVK